MGLVVLVSVALSLALVEPGHDLVELVCLGLYLGALCEGFLHAVRGGR